jgi:hypothetical protein
MTAQSLLLARTVALFTTTALAEIVGRFLPYLWLKHGKSAWLLLSALAHFGMFGVRGLLVSGGNSLCRPQPRTHDGGPLVKISLLIAEHGASWLEHARGWRKPSNDLMVLTQDSQESNHEFRTRVTERIERLGRQRTLFDQVMLVAGGRLDGAALLARAQMLGFMLAKLGDNVRVLLDPGAAADLPARIRMRALARTVAEMAGGPAWRIQLA